MSIVWALNDPFFCQSNFQIFRFWPEVRLDWNRKLHRKLEWRNFETHLSFKLSKRMVCCGQILWKLSEMWHNSWVAGLEGFDHRWHRLYRNWTGSWTGFCFWWASRAWWNSRWWIVTTSWRSNMLSRFFAVAISKKIWNWKTEIWFLWFTRRCVNNFNINLKKTFRFLKIFIKNSPFW